MRNKCIKTKRGAASFYIVAFSTLILMVIATSFAMVVITEVSRSANDDLSQSAYDSALAGIEDAKVAFSNYRRCREAGVAPGVKDLDGGGDSKTISCNDIIYWMEHPDCNMVGHILGKIPKYTNDLTEVLVGGVEITDSDGKNSTTNQAYTCVTIDTELNDYRMTLGSKKQQQIVKLQTGRVDSQGHTIDDDVTNVSKIRISWASTQSDENNYLKYLDLTKSGKFPTAAIVYNPPIVEVQLVQTSNSFTMQSFDEVGDKSTNRGTLYLIPKKESNVGSFVNQIKTESMVKSNNRMQTNEPVVVSCPETTTSDFHCVAEIEIPKPIGGETRNNNTFMMAISLPYQKPSTDFSIELICSNGASCGNVVGKVNPKDENSDNIVKLKNTQVSIDSTGRANDLYRRVETRVETSDSTFDFDYPYYPLQVLGGAVSKKMAVLQESRSSFYFSPYN